MPAAFLRRCIQLELKPPNEEDLLEIGLAHFPSQKKESLQTIAKALAKARKDADRNDPLGTAEFLDTVRACTEMTILPESDAWNDLIGLTFLKPSGGA